MLGVDALDGPVLMLTHMNNNQQRDTSVAVHTSTLPQGTVSGLELTVEAFLRSLVGKNRSPATLRAYGADLRAFTTWLRENDDVLDHPGGVRRADIEAYLSTLGKAGISGVSRARKLAAIREYFRFLEDHGAIPRSPAAGIATPRREKRARTYLRSEEYNQLLSLAGASPRDYAILQVFLQTGVRVSELCALTLDDIDLSGRNLRVRGGKGMADRDIELEKKAVAALRSWLTLRPRVGWDHLFLNYQGEPFSERGVRKLLAKYRVHADLSKKATPHTLRHTFASIKVQRGVSLRQVQEWLGHKNLNTTQLYTHLDRQDAHKAMEATSL